MIDSALLQRFEIDAPGVRFDQLGLVNSTIPNTLSFLDEERFVGELSNNPNVAGVIVTPLLAARLRDECISCILLEHEDPRWAYFSMYNEVAVRDRVTWPSEIAGDAVIHPAAVIAGSNVRIGARSVIGPCAVILEDVSIGADCVVQAGTVIGSVGFEIKRTSRGPLSVVHDGGVRIGDRVEIGANTAIDKGFRNKQTIIEDEAKIDNVVHVAHGVRVGRAAFVVAGSVLGGSSSIGQEAWLSINASVAPGMTVENGGFVSIGAVVTRDVPAGAQVTGNFAIPHSQFLALFKKGLASLSSEDGG